jgi:single-strand DNA-binding protein
MYSLNLYEGGSMSKGTVNKVILIGRLGKDPDMRYAPSGMAIANFTMATNHSTKDADGNWTEQTEWHSIRAFGRQAEFCGEYMKKGRQVFVEGRLQTSSWEDQNGQKRYRTDVIANELQLLGSKQEGGDTAEPVAQQAAPATNSSPDKAAPEPAPMEEDDLPF